MEDFPKKLWDINFDCCLIKMFQDSATVADPENFGGGGF